MLAALCLVAPLVPSDPPSADAARWLALDEEIEELMRAGWEDPTVTFSGFAAGHYADTGDRPGGGGNDLGDFGFDAIRLDLTADYGALGVRIGTEWFTGSGMLVDGYAWMRVHEHVELRAGQFRQPFLRTGLIELDDAVLLSPTRNGQFFRVRDASRQGVMATWSDGRWRARAAVQDGVDGGGDELLLTLRGEVDALGEGVGLVEGAYGAPDEAALTVGAAWTDDGSADDLTALALDAAFTRGPLSVQAEVVDYDDAWTALDVALGIILPTETEAGRGDTTPWSLTVSHLVGADDEFELIARFDDFDDGLERSLLTVGAAWYVAGHDAKLQAQFSTEDSAGDDVDLVVVGGTLSF